MWKTSCAFWTWTWTWCNWWKRSVGLLSHICCFLPELVKSWFETVDSQHRWCPVVGCSSSPPLFGCRSSFLFLLYFGLCKFFCCFLSVHNLGSLYFYFLCNVYVCVFFLFSFFHKVASLLGQCLFWQPATWFIYVQLYCIILLPGIHVVANKVLSLSVPACSMCSKIAAAVTGCVGCINMWQSVAVTFYVQSMWFQRGVYSLRMRQHSAPKYYYYQHKFVHKMFYKVLTPTVTHVFEQLNMFSLLEGANSAPLHSLARFDTSSRKRRGWKGWEKTPPPPRNKYLVTAVSLCSRWCTRHLNVSRRLTCCAME